ncbi:MAG: Ig-like domain-containing protein, partial [Gemmatimonadaceae bacterium]
MSSAAGLALALATTGCLQDGGATTGPATGAARLAVTATVVGAAGGASGSTAAAVTALAVRVVYLRDAAEPGVLMERQIPLDGVTSGSTLTQPLTLELGPCLADPLHLPDPGSCRVLVRATLLAGAAALDVVTIGPLDLRPGESSAPADITLHAVGTLAVTPGLPAPLFIGQDVQLTGTLSDVTGAVVTDRQISWATDAAAVATVDATGRVVAVGPGTATITASGGDRATTVVVTVRARPIIQLEKPSVALEGRQGAEIPERQAVLVVNGVTGPLDGLALGEIAYDGDVTDWLTATLSGGAAPATLYLRPSHTDLAPGSYTATVPLTAPDAENSGIAVRVSYTVSPGVLIVVDQSDVQLGSPNGASQLSVAVTAAEPLGGLAVGSVVYADSVTGWLSATLSDTVTPATLGLQLSGTDLPVGSYSARVPLTAPGASNSGIEVTVNYTVSPPILILLDQSRIEFDDPLGQMQTSVVVGASEPLSGLTASVSFDPYASGWLTAQLSSDGTPANLLLNSSTQLFPGIYQADVSVSAPDAANEALVQVVRTVPGDNYFLYTSTVACVFVGDSAGPAADSILVDVILYQSDMTEPTTTAPYSVRALGPGLTIVDIAGVTGDTGFRAVRTPGFLGATMAEVTIGNSPTPPGALTDTARVAIYAHYDDYYTVCAGTARRAPYVPGAPSFRRAPAGGTVRPAPRPAT